MSPQATPQPAIRRRSSLLSLRSSPGDPVAGGPTPAPAPRDMTPPPQDPYATTAVVLHDASYKHRYSRPKTSQAELASIVERPERIPAAVLGICAAQVRAGKERLSINKSSRLGRLSDPEVMLVHAHTPAERGKKSWPEELAAMCGAAGEKLKRGQVEVPGGYHQGDLYLCGESLEDLEGCVGAVYDGVDAVFGNGPVTKSFVCIRPPGMLAAVVVVVVVVVAVVVVEGGAVLRNSGQVIIARSGSRRASAGSTTSTSPSPTPQGSTA